MVLIEKYDLDSYRVSTREKRAEWAAYMDGARSLMKTVETLEAEENWKDAAAKLGQLKSQYGRWKAAAGLKYPVFLDVSPPSAEVYLDNERLGAGPTLLRLDGDGRDRTLLVEQENYTSQKLNLKDHLIGTIQVRLEKTSTWRHQTEGVVRGGAAFVGETAVVADSEGCLYGLHVQKGTEQWKLELSPGKSFEASLLELDGRVLIGGENGTVYSVDPGRNSARIEWTYDAGAPIRRQLGRSETGALIYCVTEAGDLHAIIRTSGKKGWTVSLGEEVRGGLAVDGTAIYVGTEEGDFIAIAVATGEELWRVNLGNSLRSTPVRVGNLLLVGSNDGRLHAVSAVDGSTAWSIRTGGKLLGRPTVADGAAFFGSEDGFLYRVSVQDAEGTIDWKFDVGSPITGSPGTDGENVFVGADGGRVVALGCEDGKLAWEYEAEGDVRSRIAVYGELLFVGSDFKDVHALSRR
jgi:outer membrane protein assembly factor BamB